MTSIREAKKGDAESLLECHTVTWESLRGVLPDEWIDTELKMRSDNKTIERFEKTIEDPDRIIVVAESEGTIAGFAQGGQGWGGVKWLGFFGVRPEHRGRGLGKGLLEKFLEVAEDRKFHKVILNTSPKFSIALKLYTQAGFLPEGLLRNHFYGEDIIIYSKSIE